MRAYNKVKHVCVAARIGEDKAPGEGNSRSIAKTSNAVSRGGRSRFQALYGLDATPQRDEKRTDSTRFTHTSTVASPQAGPLLHATVRRRFWLQPFGLARVLACSSRLSAKGLCLWGGDGSRAAQRDHGSHVTVPASGPAANESRRRVVERSLA